MFGSGTKESSDETTSTLEGARDAGARGAVPKAPPSRVPGWPGMAGPKAPAPPWPTPPWLLPTALPAGYPMFAWPWPGGIFPPGARGPAVTAIMKATASLGLRPPMMPPGSWSPAMPSKGSHPLPSPSGSSTKNGNHRHGYGRAYNNNADAANLHNFQHSQAQTGRRNNNHQYSNHEDGTFKGQKNWNQRQDKQNKKAGKQISSYYRHDEVSNHDNPYRRGDHRSFAKGFVQVNEQSMCFQLSDSDVEDQPSHTRFARHVNDSPDNEVPAAEADLESPEGVEKQVSPIDPEEIALREILDL
jgi:hypothetical protein